MKSLITALAIFLLAIPNISFAGSSIFVEVPGVRIGVGDNHDHDSRYGNRWHKRHGYWCRYHESWHRFDHDHDRRHWKHKRHWKDDRYERHDRHDHDWRERGGHRDDHRHN